MERLQAFRYELRPNGEQQRTMRRFAGSCRFVFNKALALQQGRYGQGAKKLGYAGLCKALTEWKAQPETLWLNDTHSQPLQQTLKDLERAYVNFFEKRADFPRFKKKGLGDSFRYPQGCKLEQGNSRIFLPKVGWLRYRNSRPILGKVCNVTVSQNHAMVCIEDLQIRNMSRSAKGTAETPGKRVRQKSGLNRSILDQGWGEFRRQLDYKLAWRGGHLIAVAPHNTSRTCPQCGHVSKENRQTQAQFKCVECRYENNADVVGAMNVLERGQRLIACGERVQSGRSLKQEPAEASLAQA